MCVHNQGTRTFGGYTSLFFGSGGCVCGRRRDGGRGGPGTGRGRFPAVLSGCVRFSTVLRGSLVFRTAPPSSPRFAEDH